MSSVIAVLPFTMPLATIWLLLHKLGCPYAALPGPFTKAPSPPLLLWGRSMTDITDMMNWQFIVVALLFYSSLVTYSVNKTPKTIAQCPERWRVLRPIRSHVSWLFTVWVVKSSLFIQGCMIGGVSHTCESLGGLDLTSVCICYPNVYLENYSDFFVNMRGKWLVSEETCFKSTWLNEFLNSLQHHSLKRASNLSVYI